MTSTTPTQEHAIVSTLSWQTPACMYMYGAPETNPLNPLTTNDDYSRHRNSATCYQLAQSVLKIGSALAERVGQGEVGGCTTLAIEWAWSVLDGPFFCFLVQTGIENSTFTLYGLHFWLFRQLSVWRSVPWTEGPDY